MNAIQAALTKPIFGWLQEQVINQLGADFLIKDSIGFYEKITPIIKNLIKQILLTPPQFVNCKEESNNSDKPKSTLICSPSDSSPERLIISTGPGLKGCGAPFLANTKLRELFSIELHEEDNTSSKGISCFYTRRTLNKITNYLTCQGTGTLSPYKFIVTGSADSEWAYATDDCTEFFSETSKDQLNSKCYGSLTLFGHALQNTPVTPKKPEKKPEASSEAKPEASSEAKPEASPDATSEASPEPKLKMKSEKKPKVKTKTPPPNGSFWHAAKMSAGIASAFFFSYLTVEEVCKPPSKSSQKNEKLPHQGAPGKTIRGRRELSQRSLTKEPTDQRSIPLAIAYATAASVSLLLART